jgi:hypothetical protein
MGVVAAAFGLAVLGLGFGFYGPPIFLSAVREARGWPLALVSTFLRRWCGDRRSARLVATPSRCGLTHRAMVNLSDHAILRLFCPTRQQFRQTPKPLIPLVRATVHGVVFDIFVLEGTKASG